MKNTKTKLCAVGLLALTLLMLGSTQIAFGYIPGVTYLTWVSVPSDKSVTEGDSVSVTWKAKSDWYGKGYRIYKNGALVKSGTWKSYVAITYSYTTSSVGTDQLKCYVYDATRSRTDYCYITVVALDTDSDGLTDIEELYYTKTPINSPEDFSGPTVDVRVLFRSGAASVTLGGRLDSDGYGTIPRRLYHSIQKSICTLTSNIVKVLRTDKIKVLQIDDWALTYYGSHAGHVFECMVGVTYVAYLGKYDIDFYDIDDNTEITYGLQHAKTEGYDLICIALGLTMTYTQESYINTLVEELGTTIICGTGNDGSSTILSRAAHEQTIAVGAAWISILNPDSIVEESNYGEGMDFVCHSLKLLCKTSWATGYCTGYAINMLCGNQNLDPVTLRDLMRQSADKIEDQDHTYGVYPYSSSLPWPDYGWCDVFGYGYITNSACHQSAIDQLAEPY